MGKIGNWIFVCFLFFFVACQNENDTVPATEIDPEIQEYVDRFVEEAELRNVELDLKGLVARFNNIQGERVIGQCIVYTNDSREIVLDQQYWISNVDVKRELLVFHELGHCVLDLGHNDDIDANGVCVSIMNSGTASCQLNYNKTTRAEFLDELFEQ